MFLPGRGRRADTANGTAFRLSRLPFRRMGLLLWSLDAFLVTLAVVQMWGHSWGADRWLPWVTGSALIVVAAVLGVVGLILWRGRDRELD